MVLVLKIFRVMVDSNINPILTKAGEERQIEWYNQAVKDQKGNLLYLLAVGQDITDLPAHQRPVNMMFQSYALFPHMTVQERMLPATTFKPELASLNMGSMNFGLYPMLDRFAHFTHEWERENLEK